MPQKYFFIICRLIFHPDLTPEEVTVMKYFTGFIADFVKYGKPTYGNKDKIYPQQWLPFQPGRGISMLIENPPRISRDLPFKSLFFFTFSLLLMVMK